MADFSVTKGDPPANEELLPDISKLHIDESAKMNKICLSDLHQDYIDRITDFVGLKGIILLQKTCRDLYHKGFVAQKRHKCSMIIDCQEDGTILFTPQCLAYLRWNEKKIRATNFWVRARKMIIHKPLTSADLERVTGLIGGRGSIDTLTISHPFVSGEVDPAVFSQFLETFKVFCVDAQYIPVEFLQLPAVKKICALELTEDFPLPLTYFLDSSISSCVIGLDLDFIGIRLDSQEMSGTLEKWTKNEKIIGRYIIFGFNFDEEQLFPNWTIVNDGDRLSAEKPFVIRRVPDYSYRLIRSDDAVLSMNVGEDPGRIEIWQGEHHPTEEEDWMEGLI